MEEIKKMNASLEAGFKELKERFITVGNLLMNKGGVQVPDEEYSALDYLADGLYAQMRYIFCKAEDINALPIQEVPFEGVDLGLPSGKKWASANVGATSPEESGVLLTFDQANALKFDDGFHVPTSDDFQELYDHCDWEWTKENGVKGYRVKSKTNGNHIFFPCSGNGDGASWYNRGSYGYYWSASLYSATDGRNLYFYSGGVYPQGNNYRFYGFAVRPVQ